MLWSKLFNSLSIVNDPITYYFFPPAIAGVNASGSSSFDNNRGSLRTQIGYNQQFDNIVGGIEISYIFGNTNEHRGGSFLYTTVNQNYVLTSSVAIKQLVTVRPRVGFIIGNLMPYITGGYASSKIEFHQEFSDPDTEHPGLTSFSKTKSGWTLGVGGEYSLNRNSSLKAEYLFSEFSRSKAIGSINNVRGASPIIGPVDGATFNNYLNHLTTQNVNIGINFHMV